MLENFYAMVTQFRHQTPEKLCKLGSPATFCTLTTSLFKAGYIMDFFSLFLLNKMLFLKFILLITTYNGVKQKVNKGIEARKTRNSRNCNFFDSWPKGAFLNETSESPKYQLQ